MKKLSNRLGFTLIELLVVIAIIGILAVAFLPNVLGAPGKARDAQRIAAVNSIANVLVAQSLVATPVTGASGTAGCASAVVTSAVQTALGTVPTDPQGNSVLAAICNTPGQYVVQVAPNENYKYAVVAKLEQAMSVSAGTANSTTPGAKVCPTAANTDLYAEGPATAATDCYVVFVK